MTVDMDVESSEPEVETTDGNSEPVIEESDVEPEVEKPEVKEESLVDGEGKTPAWSNKRYARLKRKAYQDALEQVRGEQANLRATEAQREPKTTPKTAAAEEDPFIEYTNQLVDNRIYDLASKREKEDAEQKILKEEKKVRDRALATREKYDDFDQHLDSSNFELINKAVLRNFLANHEDGVEFLYRMSKHHPEEIDKIANGDADMHQGMLWKLYGEKRQQASIAPQAAPMKELSTGTVQHKKDPRNMTLQELREYRQNYR